MIVSHRHRFIFLKTEKTASTSMEIALSGVLGPDDIITPAQPDLERARASGIGGQNYRLEHPDVPKIPRWRRLLGRPERYHHPTVGYYEHMPGWRVKRYLGDDIWSSYFKFAFERNPWDRQVSYYHYKTRSKPNPPDFDAFMARGLKSRMKNWEIYTIDGRVAVDFLGRYEDVAEGFADAMGEVGLGGQVELPRANIGRRKANTGSYRDYYNDHTRALIAEWYRPEIAHFGYEF